MRATKSKKAVPPDLIFENHFSLFLIRPITKVGQDWVDAHIPADAQTIGGNAIACEPRYVADVFIGAVNDGLQCEHGGLLQ